MGDTSRNPPPADEGEAILATSDLHERYGALLRWIFGLVFGSISYPAECSEQVHRLARRGVVIYVARAQSTWLALYLDYALGRLGLPLARFAAGVNLLLWQPVDGAWKALRPRVRTPWGPWRDRPGVAPTTTSEALLAEVVLRGESALLFLRGPRRDPWPTSKASDYLRTLVAAQRLSDRPFLLVPHAVTDRMLGGATGASLADRVRGVRGRPGQRHRLTMPLLARRARVRAGDAIDLKALTAEHPDDDDDTLARRLRRELDRRISAEERVVAGPELPTFGAVKRRVLRDALVKDAILAEATRTGARPGAVEASAARHLKEIAARYSPRVTSLFAASMNWAFGRIYDGIVVDAVGLARVIEASRRGPLVFCPSHKSHVDYLVLSLAFWNQGVTPPHIAAGANLSFFPLGPLFRRSGAFFLRRSFRNDPVYSAVFRAYVVELVRRGTALEFFIEGGRSRTGQVRIPKLGLVSMAVDAWRRGASDDIQFVPASVDYERIIESAAYERELKGAEKRPEGLAALFRATRVLRSRYGRVHLQFGEPVSLAEIARQAGQPQDQSPQYDEAWRAEVERLGHRIRHRVATICSVTPTAVAATAFLCHSGGRVAESLVLKRAREILDYLAGAAARIPEPLADGAVRDSAVLKAVRRFVEDGAVAMDRPEGRGQEALYRVVDERRIALDFYKNAVMNYAAGGAIVCRALRLHGGRRGYREVREDAGFLLRLFSREFVCPPDRGPEACLDGHLATLAGRGFLDVYDDGRVVERDPARTALLAGLLDSFVEVYWLVAATLADLRRSPLRGDEMVGRAMERARRGLLGGQITRPECVNRALMQSAVEWMTANGVVENRGSGEERTLRLTPEYELGRLETLIDEIAVFR